MAHAKAAKPARRKTAKKHQVVRRVKKPRALSKRDMQEMSKLINEGMQFGQAAVKVSRRPAAKREKSKVDVSDLLFASVPCGFDKRGKMSRYRRLDCIGVSEKLAPPVVQHRMADMDPDMLHVSGKKLKQVRVNTRNSKRIKQGLVVPKLMHNGRVLIQGAPMSPAAARRREEEWSKVYHFDRRPNPTAILPDREALKAR